MTIIEDGRRTANTAATSKPSDMYSSRGFGELGSTKRPGPMIKAEPSDIISSSESDEEENKRNGEE